MCAVRVKRGPEKNPRESPARSGGGGGRAKVRPAVSAITSHETAPAAPLALTKRDMLPMALLPTEQEVAVHTWDPVGEQRP